MCSFAQPRVSEELSDWQNVFAIPRFRFFEVLFHFSYYYWAKETRSWYWGLRYIEFLLYTCPPHPHPTFIILNTCTLSLRWVSILVHLWVGEGVGGGAQDKPTQAFILRYVFTIVGLVPMLSRLRTDNSIRLLYSSFQFFKTINNNFLLLHG